MQIHAPEETADFTKISKGLLINGGTMDLLWVEGMKNAAKVAYDNKIPWILDPCGCGATYLKNNTFIINIS